MDASADFLEFLSLSPTAYHAARTIGGMLEAAQFKRLDERTRWELKAGNGYYAIRDDGLVAAFRLPKKQPVAAIVVASHLDSPALKLKPRPLLTMHGIGQMGTEVYGSPLLHTWLDRDLYIAGRVSFEGPNGEIKTEIVSLKEHPVFIPGLALHLDRAIGEKGVLVQKQEHLKAIFSLHPKDLALEELLKRAVSFRSLLGFDLFLVPLEAPSLLGFDREFIAGYRLDNLTSAYASAKAACKATPRTDTVQLSIFWDHEEIGSMSYSGAGSLFASQILERIALSYQLPREELMCMMHRSICLSCDLAHGMHPNYSDKYDPQNAPYLAKGPILKFNANQKYATSARSAAPLIHLAQKKKIPLQMFASRSDIPSGSTVGSIMAANIGMPTLDLGIAGWSMHSIRETVAAEDLALLTALLHSALEELSSGVGHEPRS